MIQLHPCKDEHGQPVEIKYPHQASAPNTWNDSRQIATTTPGSPMLGEISGIAINSWVDPPTDPAGWEELATASSFDEAPYRAKPGMRTATGAVVVESEGRVWVISPSNQFMGYRNTFPKGRVDAMEGLSLRANALKEVFEESGLKIELTGFLCDSPRSQSFTRYYLARRIGGNPADMGWESQAVHLVPLAQLARFASHPNDVAIVKALLACWGSGRSGL